MEDIQNLINQFFEQFSDNEKIKGVKEKLGSISPETSDFIPSKEFEQYLVYKEKYNQAKSLLDQLDKLMKTGDMRAIQEASLSKPIYQTMISNALNLWITIGYKNEIEKIIAQTT